MRIPYLTPEARQGPQEERLIDDLLVRRRYNQLARPVSKESDALEVEFGLSLQQIVDVVRDNYICKQVFGKHHNDASFNKGGCGQTYLSISSARSCLPSCPNALKLIKRTALLLLTFQAISTAAAPYIH